MEPSRMGIVDQCWSESTEYRSVTADPCHLRPMRDPLSRTESPSPMSFTEWSSMPAADCPQAKYIWHFAKHLQSPISASRDGQEPSAEGIVNNEISRRAISIKKIAGNFGKLAVDLQLDATNNNYINRQQLNRSWYFRAADRSENRKEDAPLPRPFKNRRFDDNLSQTGSVRWRFYDWALRCKYFFSYSEYQDRHSRLPISRFDTPVLRAESWLKRNNKWRSSVSSRLTT